jgi:tetratricopeptide (TPR) repeat protein
MSNLAQLKQKARSFEQREQWPSALGIYEQMTQEKSDGHDPDVGLWNRIGDLHMRLGRAPEAVAAYERAVEAYAAVGLHNNAIALCNKILRITPGRPAIYLKLGMISALKGFFADARKHLGHFVELGERGDGRDAALDVLVGAIDSYASDDSEVRRAVAEQLHAHGRDDQALELFRAAHRVLVDRGYDDDASRVWKQVLAIDPGARFDPPADRPAGLDLDADDPAADGGLQILTAHADATDPADAEEAGSLLEIDEEAYAEPAEILHLDGFEATTLEISSEVADDDAMEPVGLCIDSPTTHPVDHDATDDALLDGFRLDLPIPAADPIDHEDVRSDHRADEGLDHCEPALPPLALLSDFGSDLDSGAPSDDAAVSHTDGAETAPEAGLARLPGSWPANQESLGEDLIDGDVVPDWSDALMTPWEDETVDAGTAGALAGATGEYDGIPSRLEDDELHDDAALELEGLPTGEATDGADVTHGDDGNEYDFSFAAAGAAVSEPIAAADPLAELGARLNGEPADLTAAVELAAIGGTDAEAVLGSAIESLAARGEEEAALTVLRHLLPLGSPDRHLLQRQVELAHRAGDSDALVRAYLELAECVQSHEDEESIRVLYERVLEIDPDHSVARAALGFPESSRIPESADGYIDLAALIMEDEPEPGSTRFVVEADAPTGDEDHDFREILASFREQVSRNIAHDDADAHYDLGVAFKEMGLLEEATSEFQLALRAGANPLATMEMLGECFVAREQHAVGRRVLEGAVRAAATPDGEMVGLLYWMARCEEALGHRDAAAECYERVLAVDVRFRDAAIRLRSLIEQGAAIAF